MKLCRKCGEVKPLEAFHMNKNRPDGRQHHCAECVKAYLRTYYLSNKGKYVRTDPVAIAAHREQIWRRHLDPAVREAKRIKDRAAYRKDPDRYKAAAMRRRARVQGAPVAHFTEKDWRRIVVRQDGRCLYCGVKAELTKDHLIPLARGGSHSVGNIVAACSTCNCKKRTRTRTEFLIWLKRMGVAA